MDFAISKYNELNKSHKIVYLYNLNLVLNFIEGKELKPGEIIHPRYDDRSGYLECYESYLPKIKDLEIKTKCERFIKLRKANIALLDELDE